MKGDPVFSIIQGLRVCLDMFSKSPMCGLFFQGHSRSWDVMHTLYCTQTPIHLAFFYLRQTLTTQIVQNILLNMSRLHMMMHDLHSKGHLTVKVIEGQIVFMDIWIFVNITTKWSDICINTIYQYDLVYVRNVPVM